MYWKTMDFRYLSKPKCVVVLVVVVPRGLFLLAPLSEKAARKKKETRICFRCGSLNCMDLNKCPDKGKSYDEWAAVQALAGKNFAQTSSSGDSVANSTVTKHWIAHSM